jgi:hypothetical protein
MASPPAGPFPGVPRTPVGHFRLAFYAAVYQLLIHLRLLAALAGEDLDATLARHPFLGGYLRELLAHLPDGITWEQGPGWWEEQLAGWVGAGPDRLPLRALAERADVGHQACLALMTVGLVEEDSRFGTVFAELQRPMAYRRPCLETVGRIVAAVGPAGHAHPPDAADVLLEAGLVRPTNRDAPRSEWTLAVPPVLWKVLKGWSGGRLAPWCRHLPQTELATPGDLVFPGAFVERVGQVPGLLRDGRADALVVRGMRGSERLEIAGAVARGLGRGVVSVEATGQGRELPWELLGPICAITGSMPVVEYDLGPGETAELPPLPGYRGPVGLLLGPEGGVAGGQTERAVTLSCPPLTLQDRRRRWRAALADCPAQDLDELAERFLLPGGRIRQAAAGAATLAALEGRAMFTTGDVREACRALSRQLLDTLAAPLEAEGSWRAIVVSGHTTAKLQELERRCRHRERILAHVGPALRAGANRGVRALFTGASGTGKTLAAKLLAAELGMDLYRVDLGAVVNKYIGETEKNLHRVLSTAEELDVVLLLDEGDALLGNRTEVKSANDRYANLETNYLLQRLESYQGIVVVTTNLGGHIDKAFQRRMDVMVSFVRPGPEERWHIWQLHLPEDHAIDPGHLEDVAVRCVLTGGQIRNAAIHATLLALDQDRPVGTADLDQAILDEYRKAGATSPFDRPSPTAGHPGPVESFLDSLL